jgi:TolB-like protein
MKIKWILFFVVINFVTHAQKPKDYTVVIDALTDKLQTAHLSDKPLRLAVVPLANTQSASANKFGEYVTESIISKLSDQPGKFKIFERKRLDAILKEDELILSDLMLPEAAQKIGKLAPIDALFSGTYTKLKTYVDVSSRLIDVASGEILVSYSGRIKLTKNLKTLFPEGEVMVIESKPVMTINQQPKENHKEQQITFTGKSREEICKQLVKDFKIKLNDLSTKERVDAVVSEAMKTPFDNQCGKLHYELIYSLNRFKIKNETYPSFLLATLDSIRFPSQDDRAYEITRFMARDSVIDFKEWKVGLHTISKVGDYTLSTYIGYLLARTKSDDDELHDRIDAYFQLANAQKIGLPKPVAYNTAFFEMMEGVKANVKLEQYVYEKYAGKVELDVRSASSINAALRNMYKEEKDKATKTKIISWMADFFNAHEDEKMHEHLYDLAWAFNLTTYEARNEEIRRDFPEADLKLLVEKCRNKFSDYAMKTPYNSQQEDRINFCVKYNVPILNVIPTMAEAEVILKGSDLKEQLRVMKLLVQMGDKPKPLENTLIGLLSKRSLEDKEKMTEIQSLTMAVLGHIKTNHAEAIKYMTSQLMSFNYLESDNATHALVEIGKPAVNSLIKSLSATTDQDGGLRYKIIVILGKIGHDAKPAEPLLKKLLNENRNADVRYAIEAAIQAIQ